MHKKINEILKMIEDPALNQTVLGLMNQFGESFCTQPAGCSMHHAYDGGLLDHSYDTAIFAGIIADRYKNKGINKSMCIAGAFLHDIGKVRCYEPREPNPNKPNSPKYSSTRSSILHHHIPIGFHLVAQQTEYLVNKNLMTEKSSDELLHIIVSHHGRIEWSSPRRPQTDEAFIVSQADMMDAYMGAKPDNRRSFNK